MFPRSVNWLFESLRGKNLGFASVIILLNVNTRAHSIQIFLRTVHCFNLTVTCLLFYVLDKSVLMMFPLALIHLP